MNKNFKAIIFDNMPTDKINARGDIQLLSDKAELSAYAHQHIFDRHQYDYEFIINQLDITIKHPSYFAYNSKSKKNIKNFILIRRIAFHDKNLLVAISKKQNKQGLYNIQSAYAISNQNLDKRIAKKELIALM